MHARHIGFGNLVFAVIGPNVAVYIKKPENLAPPGDALPRDFPTESIAALQSSETCEFTAQWFSLRACDPGRQDGPVLAANTL